MSAGPDPIHLALPPDVIRIAERVEAVGGAAFVVGGAVRDALLGRPVEDLDLATDLLPAQVVAAFADHDDRDAGLGVVEVRSGGPPRTVTTLRVERDYGPDRRPREVSFVTRPEDDAVRRDFSVNAIYVAIPSGAVRDPQRGIADCAARVLRVIGDPRVRFREDPLRVLRALRFATTRGLEPDAALLAAVPATVDGVAGLSGARIGEEVLGALAGGRRDRVPAWIADHGLTPAVFPELDTTSLLGAAERLAGFAGGTADALALLLGFGDAERTRAILDRFAIGGGVRHRVLHLSTLAAGLAAEDERATLSALRRGGAEDVQTVLEAAGLLDGEAARERFARWVERASAEAMRLLGGDDVRERGIPPGPELGRLLETARAAVARAGVTRREDALRILTEVVAADPAVKARKPADDTDA